MGKGAALEDISPAAPGGAAPVGPGHIAQKSRHIFEDDFLRNVIVSICFLIFSSNFFCFRVPNKS